MLRTITIIFMLFPTLSFSQWNNAGNNYTTGRLGIGTSNPGFQLEIRKSTSPYFFLCRDAPPGNDSYSYNMMSSSYHVFGSNKNGTGVLRKIGFAIGGSDSEADVKMTIDVNGTVGIGASVPLARLHTNGSIYSSATRTNSIFSGSIGINNANFIGSEGYWALRTATNNSFNLDVRNSASPIAALTVLQNGYIGVGTTSPDAKLTGAGNIHSREVKVTVNAGADFVFNDDYEPISLTELEKFIRDKRHLPEVPSAEEMERGGLELGAMNILLLKKIEEMTLYVLYLKKENEELKLNGKGMQEMNEMLNKKLEALVVIVNDLKINIEEEQSQ